MSRYAPFKVEDRWDCTHTRRRCANLKKDKKPWYPHGDTVQNSQYFLWKNENAGSSWGVVQSYKRTHNIRLPRPFGFYSNGNNECNRNELGRQLIHQLDALWSSVGKETLALAGTVISFTMKISKRQKEAFGLFFVMVALTQPRAHLFRSEEL